MINDKQVNTARYFSESFWTDSWYNQVILLLEKSERC
jgi:hypothetical protein